MIPLFTLFCASILPSDAINRTKKNSINNRTKAKNQVVKDHENGESSFGATNDKQDNYDYKSRATGAGCKAVAAAASSRSSLLVEDV